MIYQIFKEGLKEGYYLIVDSRAYDDEELCNTRTMYKRSQILQDVFLWSDILKASSDLYGSSNWNYIESCEKAFPKLSELFLKIDPLMYSDSETLQEIQDELLEVSNQEDAGCMWIYLTDLYNSLMGRSENVQVRLVDKLTTVHLPCDVLATATILGEEVPPHPENDNSDKDDWGA